MLWSGMKDSVIQSSILDLDTAAVMEVRYPTADMLSVLIR